MKERPQEPRLKQAFTLIELLVVIGILCLLASLMLPALARARIKSPAAGCLSNLRQMQLGWSMYKDDNNDYMMPNAPYSYPASQSWCGTAQMNWTTSMINTNQAYYETSLMAPYIGNQIGLYRCPADVVPSQNGPRIRSYSMNGQMGMVYFQKGSAVASEDSGAMIYVKASDVIAPAPASAAIFIDESTYTLLEPFSDGYLEIATLAANAGFPDAPAARHSGGCGLSYVDGHSEVHKWQTTLLTSLPTAYGQAAGAGGWGVPQSAANASNADFVWWSQHTAAKANGQLGP